MRATASRMTAWCAARATPSYEANANEEVSHGSSFEGLWSRPIIHRPALAGPDRGPLSEVRRNSNRIRRMSLRMFATMPQPEMLSAINTWNPNSVLLLPRASLAFSQDK